MFLVLTFKVIKIYQVKETADFLLRLMPLMLIPSGVGLINAWSELMTFLIPVIVITLLSTVIVMVVTGKITQFIAHRFARKFDE